MSDPIQLQSDEFTKLHQLNKAFTALPPIVDDDYPLMRGRYENALKAFLQAVHANSGK